MDEDGNSQGDSKSPKTIRNRASEKSNSQKIDSLAKTLTNT